MDYTLLFSFIIPVYNAASTLNRCLDSILVRTTPDYEILLINDSSTDNSLAICEEYAAKYPQVSVYTFPNGGAGAARNRGLEKARGKYIIFCDSDDWYNSEELNKLLDSADEHMKDIDLLCFDYRRQWVDYFEDIKHFDNETFELKDKEERLFAVSSSILSKKFGIILWNKIYKKEIIDKNNIIFPERDALNNSNDWGEDLCFNAQYVLVISHVVSVDVPIYINSMRTKRNEEDKHYQNYKNGVLDHISKMFFFVKDTFAFQKATDKDFRDFYFFQVYNNIFLETYYWGIESTKKLFDKIELDCNVRSFYIRCLFGWKSFSRNRFNKTKSDEYFCILVYLITGRMFIYKVLCKLLTNK